MDAPVVGELCGFKILKMTSSGENYKNVVVSGPVGGGRERAQGRGEGEERKGALVGDETTRRRRGGGGDRRRGRVAG